MNGLTRTQSLARWKVRTITWEVYAVLVTARHAIVAGRQDVAMVIDKDAPDSPPDASGSHGDKLRYCHEVFLFDESVVHVISSPASQGYFVELGQATQQGPMAN